MKTFGACLVCFVAATNAVSPMEKVMSMMADLKDKVIADGEAEDKTYENYTKFCVKTKRDLGYEIQDGENNVEELTATIEKASSDIDVAATRIQELQTTISKNEDDLQAALEIRKTEKAEHEAAKDELEEASDMLGRAVKTLSEKLGGSALLQQEVNSKTDGLIKALGAVVDAASFPKEEKQSLMAFVESATSQPPAVPAYTSKSGGIIQTLEDMKEKAKDDLVNLQKQEKAAQHSFNMLQQSLTMQIKADKKEFAQVKAAKSDAEEEKATADGDLDVSSKDLANDKASLEKLTASCSQADSDYEASKASRAEELKALAKATKALVEKTGAAEAGVHKPAMLLQVRAHSQSRLVTPSDLHSFEVVQLVRNLAKKSQSSGLATLAANIESLIQTRQDPDAAGPAGSDDVFAKVKELINNMITSRQEEAAAESTKKAYCEEEQGKTKEKIEDLTSKKDALSAKVDKKESEATTLKSEAATLQQELAELVKTQAEMDETRKQESATFKTQKADLEAGLEGVRTALSVLREYYDGSSSDGTTLIQEEQPTFGHDKDAGASTGIIGMLEVVESDFGRNLAEAETTEASKAEDYEKMTDQNKMTKVQKEADMKYKAKTSAALFRAVQELSSDLDAAQEELDAVLKYQESLAQQCLDGAMSYEERVAKREEEIDGLKEALVALGGADLNAAAFLQVTAKGLRGATTQRHRQ